jgi:hypothetical protein
VTARRIAAPDRVRNTNAQGKRHPNGGWACLDCGEQVPLSFPNAKRTRLRCPECLQANRLVLRVLSGRGFANAAVSRAKRKGLLPEPSTLSCVDCGRRAEQYDHRDYNEPLKVDPVCRSCNVMRGHAIPFNPYLVGLLLIARTVQAKRRARA